MFTWANDCGKMTVCWQMHTHRQTCIYFVQCQNIMNKSDSDNIQGKRNHSANHIEFEADLMPQRREKKDENLRETEYTI